MNELTPAELSLRIGISLAVGLVLGYEREQHGRAAGMRTTMLVCVASAVVMLLSEHLFWAASQGVPSWRPDPARLAAGVLAGMGFLGGGVIMRQDKAIHGVTTAAVLWFSAILGMAIGSGYLMLGFAGFLIVFIALFLLPSVEAYIQSDRYAVLTVTESLQGPGHDRIVKAVESLALGAKVKPHSMQIDNEKRRRVLQFEVKVKNRRVSECQRAAVVSVAALKGVLKAEWT